VAVPRAITHSLTHSLAAALSAADGEPLCTNYGAIYETAWSSRCRDCRDGGAENTGQDVAGQDNDGQEKHHD